MPISMTALSSGSHGLVAMDTKLAKFGVHGNQMWVGCGAVDETRWLDEREQGAWRGFVDMQTELMSRLEREMQRDAGLSGGDFAILVNLSEAPGGRRRARDLGTAIRWDKSRLSKHLTRMRARGLVGREACDTDQRGSVVVLTEQGRAAVEAAARPHAGHVRHWFVEAMTPEQLDTLAAISAAVLAGLRADAEPAAVGDN
jgi:DNA-binding MarR family transcriptional regulator